MKTFLILVFLLLPMINIYSYDVDSLYNIIYNTDDKNQKVESYIKLSEIFEDDLIKTYLYADSAFQLSNSMNIEVKIKASLNLSNVFYNSKNINMTEFMLLKTLNLIDSSQVREKYQQILVELYIDLASVYITSKNYERSLYYSKKAENLINENKFYNHAVHNLANIGYAKLRDGKKSEGLNVLLKALELSKTSEYAISDLDKMSLINDIALAYEEMNLDSAYYYYIVGVEMAFSKNDFEMLSLYYHNMAKLSLKIEKLSTSVVYLEKSIEYAKKSKNNLELSKAFLLKSVYHSKINDKNNALKYVDSSETAQNEYPQELIYLDILFEKHSIFLKFKMFDSASYYLNYYHFKRDSLSNISNNQEFFFLKTNVDLQRKIQENELLAKEIEINKKNQIFAIIIILVLIIVLFLLGFVYFQEKTNKAKIIQLNAEIEDRNIELIATNEEIHLINNELAEKQIELSYINNQLDITNASKDKFFSILAHDLKNPLSGLVLLVDVFKEYYDELSIEKRQEMIENVETSLKNTLSLLNNVLDWSRSQSGRLDLLPDYHDTKRLIDMAIKQIVINADKKKIVIINHIEDNIIGYFDANMILTVVRNILSNAIKYSYENSKIDVFANIVLNELVIEIRDYGVGMNSDEITKIFDFTKTYSKDGTNYEKGTGIGLIISKELVEKNGGRIQVKSELKIGTSFFIILPNNLKN